MPSGDAIFAGSAAATGNIIDAWQTGNINKKSREFAREMYNVQKTDNLAFWNLQNQYNSPAAQMQRFKDAGLNPNLIYGQSNQSGPISSPDVQKPEFNVPQYGSAVSGGILTALDSMYNFEMKQSQIDNLKVQNDILKEEAIFKGLLNAGTVVGNKQKLLDYNRSSDLYETDVSYRKTQLDKLKADIDLSMRRDAREAAMNASSIKEATERMLSMVDQRRTNAVSRAHSRADIERINAETRRIRENISIMEREGVLKDIEIGLRRQGINPNDPMWSRIVGMFLEKITTELSGGITFSKLLGQK